MNVAISSFGMISPSEYCSPEGTIVHPGAHLTDIPRESVYEEIYRPFGKMGDTEKLLFSACALALKGKKLAPSSGIVMGVPRGSLATDCAYMQTVRDGFPSPALFAATLPSASIAELAIPFELRGPNRVIAGSDQSSLLAHAFFLIQRGTPSVVCGYVDPDPAEGFAAVLILESKPARFSLQWDQQRVAMEDSCSLFASIVALMVGKNHIQNITTAMGTFYINEANL